MNTAAVILAAGLSSRMRRLKALLPLGDMTVLGHAITTFRQAGMKTVIVVTGHRESEVAAEALKHGARTIHNPKYEDGMFSSVRVGVSALQDNVDAFFMLPVDIPLVRSYTITRLLSARPNAPVVYPCFREMRGHPPRIDALLISEILEHDGTGGLRTVLERHTGYDVPVPDCGILYDMDTPTDYDFARSIAERAYPTTEECEILLELQGTPPHTQEHCRAVADVARNMVHALNAAGDNLDENLAWHAGLLHDIAKGSPNHELAGAAILEAEGFPQLASIIRHHTDLSMSDDQRFTEREVVFLADKIVQGTTPVPLRQRYEAKLEKFGNDPEARKAILGRLNRAQAAASHFVRESGQSLDSMTTGFVPEH